jgi:divalent metal cation (Fe/Co/Zn/Cd) transporter
LRRSRRGNGEAIMSAGGEGAAAGRRARQTSSRSLERDRASGDTKKTVVIALAANALIAVVKLAGGLLSGSTALLAEAAHSLADTTNQAFLLVSVRLGGRRPTESQPLKGGQESDGFGFLVSWITLAIAAVAEGTSWVRAMRQTRGEARSAGKPLFRYARQSRDPNVKMVLFEDSVALAGIAIAALGIGLDEVTGQTIFDPAASIAIGLLLVFVAIWMARDTGHLLVGAAALPEERETMERIIEQHEAVVEVKELLTMALGPNALLVAARVDLEDRLDAARVEQAHTEIDEALREAIPDVTEVFLDATPPADGRAA